MKYDRNIPPPTAIGSCSSIQTLYNSSFDPVHKEWGSIVVQQHRSVRSFVIVVDRRQGQSPDPATPVSGPSLTAGFTTQYARVSIHAELASAVIAPPQGSALDENDSLSLLLGDDQDAVSAAEDRYLGNGIVVHYRAAMREIDIFSSITGLPAAFLYRDAGITVIASSIQRIAAIPGIRLKPDPRGLKELANIGHPIQHRTLFENISVVPAGIRLGLVGGRELEVTGSWKSAGEMPFRSWPEYIDAQTAAMRAAVGRLNLRQSFLSLTAGLDTRAIFSLLTLRDERIPTLTLSGARITLDAKRAKQLSDHYGFPHRTVSIDSSYVDRLPQYAREASLLSGGLSSLGQAFEVHLYRTLAPGLTARISGNLGNQIGRSGTEGTGNRNARVELLSRDLRSGPAAVDKAFWLKDVLSAKDAQCMLFLIQNENLHASLGNSCIGSHFAVQQTPYSDRTLISQKLRQPPHPEPESGSVLKTRLRDLRHRFLGQPVTHSFQRRIVRDVGGFVASCPINWGWRARGGVSLTGLMFGGMAIADVVLGSRFGKNPFAKQILSSAGILGFSSFQSTDVLAGSTMQQFVADTLLSNVNLQSGVLDPDQIRSLVDRDFSDPATRCDIEFALDVVLAREQFLR